MPRCCAHDWMLLLISSASAAPTTSVAHPLSTWPLASAIAHARREATEALRADGFEPGGAADGHGEDAANATPDGATVLLRLVGQDASIEVPLADAGAMRAHFDERFRALYGYAPPPRALEIESVRVEVFAREAAGARPRLPA